jgi:hypothetical protein
VAGLTDMEELIATVSDKDVADYLREALICYGTGAHRACVVLTHIALFDGLRRKVKALAPINKVAKSVSDEIEPLATAQKVFETALIQKLRAVGIFNQLEAQILEQLNNQRNKAAHSSGHMITAEEARFVYSEAIQKFLSKPIRETSYVVDSVMAKLGDQNFFPSVTLDDMAAVVAQELANLDTSAKPFLMNKLVQALDSGDDTTAKNAQGVLITLASEQDSADRVNRVKYLFDPKSSDVKYAEFFSALVACDPAILTILEAGTKLRIRNLLRNNAEVPTAWQLYQELRHPGHVLGACLKVLGEKFMLAEMNDFTMLVVNKAPYAPEFIDAVAGSPEIFALLLKRYLDRASSSQWATSNPFAIAAPAMDGPLANAATDEQAFSILAAIVRGAEHSGNAPSALANSAFSKLPALKAKAKAYATANPDPAATILSTRNVIDDLPTFVSTYLI